MATQTMIVIETNNQGDLAVVERTNCVRPNRTTVSCPKFKGETATLKTVLALLEQDRLERKNG